MKDRFFKRHADDEIVDEIRIKVVPRFKTSGLSGDEWRVSTSIEVYRKGVLIKEGGYSSMKDAVQFLPWFVWVEALERNTGWPPKGWSDEEFCSQPGCAEKATVEYRLKQEYSERGEGPLPKKSFEHYTRFCKKHAHRGDCGLEDADDNYEVVKGSESSRADVPPENESPSAFGGVVTLE